VNRTSFRSYIMLLAAVISMILIHKLDLGILKMHPQRKNEVPRSVLSKVRPQTGRPTHKHTDVTECITTASIAGGDWKTILIQHISVKANKCLKLLIYIDIR